MAKNNVQKKGGEKYLNVYVSDYGKLELTENALHEIQDAERLLKGKNYELLNSLT